MSIFKGACTALVTPFTEDGVNFDALGKLIEFQIREGIDALLACGTTGEPSTMTEEEKRDVIRYTVEKAAGRVPVIAGTGGNNTKEVAAASEKAEELGADALLVVNPYYNKTNARGLIEHYRTVCKATSLPVIVYNVPSRTGYNITPQALLEVSEIENIAAVKEASGDIAQVLEIRRLCGDRIDIYSGNDDIIVPVLAAGGIGVISVASNIVPREVHDLVMDYLSGNIADSLDKQLKLLPLIKSLFLEVNPIPVKTAMNLLGMSMGPLRLPLYTMAADNLKILKQRLSEHGLLPQGI